MNLETLETTVAQTRMDRRSLLKRAGILGASLPVAGVLLSACGGNDDKAEASDFASTGNSGAQASGEAVELTVKAFDLGFDPDSLEVAAGQKVRLTFVNDGAMEHDWEVTGLTTDDFTVVSQPKNLSARVSDLLKEKQAAGIPYAGAGAGEEMVIEFTPAKAGEYEMICLVPGHAGAGMKGPFVVTGDTTSDDDDDDDTANEHGDAHMAGADASKTGEPYEADYLPQPVVPDPIGNREAQLVEVEIETREVIGKVDEGVAYEFWTFDGTIPGTMIRTRVGDTVELTLKNATDSKLTHNIDLHAVTGPGGGAHATTVMPGQSATIRFKTMSPGAFVYHCAVAPIPHHISAGMFGMIVVEPEGGLPPVDREFYIMQSDLYLEGARGEQGLRTFSMDKMLDERPDYVLFNGAVGSLTGENTLRANVGETVRIFFGVGGPNLTSSFHVIGEIFERVMQESATEWSSNIQTTLVPAGGATVVEFTIDVPGTYPIVDHSLGRALKGCLATIEVEGEENTEIFEIVKPAG